MTQYFIGIVNASGKLDRFPMKEWLKEHPAFLPKGKNIDASTPYELKQSLFKKGWGTSESGGVVVVIMPEEIDPNTAKKAMEKAEQIIFSLEKDLQRALRTNIEQIEKGLKVIDGGNEKITEAGRIDITAEDDNGTWSSSS